MGRLFKFLVVDLIRAVVFADIIPIQTTVIEVPQGIVRIV